MCSFTSIFLLFVFIFLFSCMFVCVTCVCPCVLHDWMYRSAFVDAEAGVHLMCWPSDPCIIYSRHSPLTSILPPFLHIVSLCFSWHHGSSLSLSVYRRGIKYRADCSIYLRKIYLYINARGRLCLIIYEQPKMTEGIYNFHAGPSSTPLEGAHSSTA